MSTLYAALVAAGCEIDNHESDLYVRTTPEAMAIIRAKSGPMRSTIKTFHSQVDGKMWLDIPFAFQPWWDARATAKV